MPRKALVLGCDSRICLGVVRSLGRGGVHVDIAGNEFDPSLLRSRYVREVHTLPAYTQAGLQWKDAVLDLLGRKHFDLVIPCTELEVIACQRHRQELERLARVYVINDRAYEVLFDKFKTNDLARSVGVPTPREIIVTGIASQDDILASFGWPVVLKPKQSLNPDDPGPIQVVQKAYDAAQLHRLLTKLLADGPVAVQENFIGTGVGVELLLSAGKPLLTFQHERLHEPMNGGPSTYRQSQPVTSDLLAASLKILQPLNYTGVAMVEFKVDKPSGKWVFLEVNARLWGSLPLALAAGVDFPLALFELLVERRTTFRNRYHTGICCRNWTLDLDWQASNLKADRSNSALVSRPLSTVLKETCANLITGRERSDTLAMDDPWPGFVELGQLGTRAASRMVRLLSGKRSRRQPSAQQGHSTQHPLMPAYGDQVYRGAGLGQTP